MSKANLHPADPVEVLANSLVNTSSRRQANLKIIFDVCARLAGDNIPITIAKVGALSVAAGGVAAQSIRNAQGVAFRNIIEAWQSYVYKGEDSPATVGNSRQPREGQKRRVPKRGARQLTELQQLPSKLEDEEPTSVTNSDLNAVEFVSSCDADSFAEVMAAGLKRLLREGWQIDDQGRLVDAWGELLRRDESPHQRRI